MADAFSAVRAVSIGLIGLGGASSAGADAPAPAPAPPPSDAGTFGVHVAIYGDPAPTHLSIGARYRILSFADVEANVGWIGFGLGTRWFVPSWPLTPVFGIAAGVTYVGREVATIPYASLGLRLRGSGGLALEAGANCTPDLLDGDLAACLPFARLALQL